MTELVGVAEFEGETVVVVGLALPERAELVAGGGAGSLFVHAARGMVTTSARAAALLVTCRVTAAPVGRHRHPGQTRLSMPQPNALQAVRPHPISTWEL
jgi:hypothetical protein